MTSSATARIGRFETLYEFPSTSMTASVQLKTRSTYLNWLSSRNSA